MSPYIFHYHNTDFDNGDIRRSYDSHHRHRNDSYREPNRKYKQDDSLYGETVYEYESDYTGSTYSHKPSKHYYDNDGCLPSKHYYDNGNQGSESHRQRRLHDSDYPKQQVQHTAPKPESHVRCGFDAKQPGTREFQQIDVGLQPEPRVSLLDKRLAMDKHTHCNCHACPQKSSKTIPAMYYDELRCPHCAAYAQPSQNDVLAYPWTAQSYRPHKRVVRTESLPPERFSTTTASIAQASRTSKALSTISEPQSTNISNNGSTVVSSHTSLGKDREKLIEKRSSIAAPPRPLFRHIHNTITRSGTRTDYSQYSNQSSVAKRRSAMSTLKEIDDDDEVNPNDSVSNVSHPIRRVKATELVPNHKYQPKTRAQTRVDENYTREKYFNSMENMPRPAKDTASEISRMLKGEYYDRRNQRTYAYNVSYSTGKIDGVRIPKT